MDAKSCCFFVATIMVSLHLTAGLCTYPPALTGLWESSNKGMLDFNSTNFGTYTVGSHGDFVFECYTVSGTKYVSRSITSVTIFSISFHVYLCLDLRYQTDSKFVYYLQTATNAGASNERVKLIATTESPSVASICDVTLSDSLYRVLVKNDSISTAKIACPDSVLATATYVHAGSNCAGGSYMDSCSNNNLLTFNYTTCSTKILYSTSGQSYCIHYVQSGGTYYLTTYNTDPTVDNTNTYRYTCIVATVSGSTVTATQLPEMCGTTQTASTVSSPGATLALTYITTCPVPTTTTQAPQNIGDNVRSELSFLAAMLTFASLLQWMS